MQTTKPHYRLHVVRYENTLAWAVQLVRTNGSRKGTGYFLRSGDAIRYAGRQAGLQ